MIDNEKLPYYCRFPQYFSINVTGENVTRGSMPVAPALLPSEPAPREQPPCCMAAPVSGRSFSQESSAGAEAWMPWSLPAASHGIWPHADLQRPLLCMGCAACLPPAGVAGARPASVAPAAGALGSWVQRLLLAEGLCPTHAELVGVKDLSGGSSPLRSSAGHHGLPCSPSPVRGGTWSPHV